MNQVNEIKLLNIRFGSYSKLSIIMGGTIGIIIGVISFIVSLFGGNVNATLGSLQLHGLAAGILSLVLEPLIFIVLGLIVSTILYLPFKIGYKLLKGVNIKGDFENLDRPESTIDERDRLIEELTYLNNRYNSAVKDSIAFLKERDNNISETEKSTILYTLENALEIK